MDFSQNYPSVIESTIHVAVQVHGKKASDEVSVYSVSYNTVQLAILLCHVSEDDVIEVHCYSMHSVLASYYST